MAHNTTASTSASNSSAPNYFHIFINHRGCDVKNTFATHLYRRLTSHGLQVFLDRPELEAGKRIMSQIEEAIQVASVQIAIFSKNYANSKWCLDELRLMVDSEERGATILPVFYNVKPCHLRWADADQHGPYVQALLKHEEKGRYDPRRIQGWREALSQVANISGFELEACRDEADLLDKVVQRVLKKVPEPDVHVAKYATGLGEKIEDFEKTVLSQREERPVEAMVVGIAGGGGIGKTTLANEFFNCKRSHYDGSSFLPDVREKASRLLLPSLQSKLIKDLKRINKEIDRWEQGIGVLKEYLKSYRALIIIDDVDDADQLDAFLPIKGVLHPKSLILVTTRDKHVLRNAGIGKASIYHLKGLNRSHSQELFCSHAFCRPHPLPGFENLVHRFVKSCDGLPLSLRVFGALLCGQGQPYWEEKLKELHRLPDKILASLKISYNSLNQKEQQIFLDIACFGIGEERDKWVTIWGGLAGLQTLEDRCLVEVKEETRAKLYTGKEEISLMWPNCKYIKVKTMRMHDHVRDMGRNIAEEVSMPRRLWRSVEDVHDLFEEESLSSVIPDVRGIRMPTRWNHQAITEGEALLRTKSEIPLNKVSSEPAIRMRTLQLLESEGEFVEGIIRRVRSPKLAWLRWNNCPCSSLPTWIPMDHLKVLEVRGPKLKKLWRRDSQTACLSNLRYLYLGSPSLKELPPSFGCLSSLRILLLHGCQELKRLPGSFALLTQLIQLEISKCGIQELPDLMEMNNLESLRVLDCPLRELPFKGGSAPRRKRKRRVTEKGLTRLELLELYCTEVREVSFPEGVCINLQTLSIMCCNDLVKVGSLPATVERLILRGCDALEKIEGLSGLARGCSTIEIGSRWNTTRWDEYHAFIHPN